MGTSKFNAGGNPAESQLEGSRNTPLLEKVALSKPKGGGYSQ